MTQTLRRELRLKFNEVLRDALSDERDLEDRPVEWREKTADKLADAALEVAGFAKKTTPVGVDWMIAAGVPSEEFAALNEAERHAKVITDCYEVAMGYSPLPWLKLERLKRFLLTKTTDEIKAFAAWSRKDYSAFTPAKARQYPDMVIDLWPQSVVAETAPLYPQYKPDPNEATYVPAPERIK